MKSLLNSSLRGTGREARLTVNAWGKTGTSQDSRSAWFVGFTPQLVTAVAMYDIGKDGKVEELRNIGGVSNVTGGSFPVRIWTSFMDKALDGKPVLDFPEPTFGGDVTNDAPPVTANPTRTYAPSTPKPTVTATKPPVTETEDPQPTVTKTRGPQPPGPSRTKTPKPTFTLPRDPGGGDGNP